MEYRTALTISYLLPTNTKGTRLRVSGRGLTATFARDTSRNVGDDVAYAVWTFLRANGMGGAWEIAALNEQGTKWVAIDTVPVNGEMPENTPLVTKSNGEIIMTTPLHKAAAAN